ncbi:ABC transporter G family member 22-like isoform X1 [Dioscorea cayenensis subsp. rotundata]|uniref:ABC transporter G family member 22-like isoform X1 n=1 Tax=Dioscorea cayennensis subsp. rotundata TaxID=55577 RepID=A0AB40AG88_DIOCR|nr:ABC transporter G family member 22-like isoform X1 [Dioscorea cayenensis subsp. rotundata]
MESASSGILRTKSEQIEMASIKQSLSRTASAETISVADTNGGLSRKSSFGKIGSPGRRVGNHTRKSRSGQLKLELDEVSSSAALSRASSAGLGFSFSFTGFTPPEDIIANLKKSFSDDDNAVDLESGGERRRKRMTTEPTLPIYLKFTGVKYKVITKGVTSTSEKEIIQGITGSASPGEVLALMGPSGSGKTTLLSLLGRRITGEISEGSITYNDEPYSKSLNRRIGFVTQDDVLFPHLTVKETLTYAALLRLPKTMTKQQKKERALDVIFELGLERCQETMIGGAFVRGVSGGERKRVCIGNEILINPSLLFLDEPTSGLDSTTALRIVEMLHGIAEDGKTVVTTIHQPSSRLFHNFDKLILLGKGSLLYYGKASEAMPYFSSIGCNPLIAMNPAEFLLDLANGNMNDISMPSELDDKVQLENLGGDARTDRPSPKDIHEYLVEAYETRVADQEKKKLLLPIPINEDLKAKMSSQKREWGANWWQQFSILFRRGFKERQHDYLSWMRITQVIATAIILGLLWWHSDSSTPKGLQDQAGLLFFVPVFWGFFPVFTAIFTFPQERAMLNKERAVDMYKLSAYFMARTTSDLPLDLILPTLFLLIVYFMAGLRPSPAPFFLTMLAVFLNIIAAEGVGLAIGATLMDFKKGTTLASVTIMTFMLAGGLFVKRVPVFISWIRYVSFNYHTYRLLLKVQYGHIPTSVNFINMGSGVREVLALIAMGLGYRLLAYFSLRMKMHVGA